MNKISADKEGFGRIIADQIATKVESLKLSTELKITVSFSRQGSVFDKLTMNFDRPPELKVVE